MTEVEIPFAIRLADRRMVAVDDVDRGLACGCVCPGCQAVLVAVKGEVRIHHFRHHVEAGGCDGGRETALHLFAKQIICDSLELSLPHDLGPMRSAAQEIWLDGIRPDVLACYDADTVAIEVYVTHRTGVDKIELLHAREQTALEIDLSYHRDMMLGESQLRQAVLRTAPRRWLYEPLVVRLQRQADLAAMKEEERLARLEEERAREAFRASQQAAFQAWQQQEAERQASLAAAAVLHAEARRQIRQQQIQQEERERAVKEQRRVEREGPNLQKLVEAYGGYNKIDAMAWQRFDREVVLWKDKIRYGDWYENTTS